MTILFLVMEFPPLNAAGVFRPLRFIRGLHAMGIDPVVVTFEFDEKFRKHHGNYDEHLLTQIPEGIPVIRIPTKDLAAYSATKLKRFYNTYFSTTDKFGKAWRENLMKVIPGLIRQYQPVAMYATAPPFSAAGLAAEISKTYDLPMILDMRDAWAKLSMSPLGSYFHYLRKRTQERQAFEQAKKVVTVTPQLRKIFRETHPSIPDEKFELVFNSIDFPLPEQLSVSSKRITDTETFNIGYTGYYYYSPEARKMMMMPWYRKKGHRMLQYTPVKEDWLYRSPYFFFQLLNRLFTLRPEWKSKIFFHHIGQAPEWLMPMAAEAALTENVILHGFLPRQKADALQQSFDLLLGTSEKVIGDEHYCLPSKLFSYLKTGKPVLGMVTKGIQAEFITKSRMGLIADPDDLDSAARITESLLQNGYRFDLDMEYLQQFHSSEAVNKIYGLFQTMIQPNIRTGIQVSI